MPDINAKDAKIEMILLHEKCEREKSDEITIEALDYVLERIELFVPGKPYGEGVCPACDFQLPRTQSRQTIQYPNCPFCGKVLDWEGFVQEEDVKWTVEESVKFLDK